MADFVPLSQNPDNRPRTMFDTEDAVRNADSRRSEEEEVTALEREGPMPACPSEFVAAAIRIPSKGALGRFDFNQRRYLRTIYDSPAKRKLLMAARQVEKSTLLGN